ncbi:hypothetical protein [Phormidium sp. CCY1219]|uniref:hypothetical protein n=1 Tax=Phormidium sp. CCY1219 TaxID=2886104 RepID=UPI002D1F34C6|nr:hypothetical protein [Phormidium sp. CCY1219]MEB3830083.1 hypothetical protein [Phormidium sp. CCY1219]
MRLVLATATLFTVAFLATSMSNTESADRANANLAVSPTTDDEMAAAPDEEDPALMASSATQVSSPEPENATDLASSVAAATNKQTAQQMLAESLRRDLDSVREIRLQGESRSPVFIPEFSAASPWANVAPPETLGAEPLQESGALARNSPVSRATVAMRDRGVSPRAAAPAVTNSVPEIMERPGVKVERVRSGDARDLLRVPQRRANPAPAIAAVPDNQNWVQPAASTRVAVRPSDRTRVLPVPERPPSSLPTLSSGQSIPVPTPQPAPVSDRARQGSAKDLLPIAQPESRSDSSAIAAVQSTPDYSETIAQTRTDIYRPDPQAVQVFEQEVQELQENAVVEDIIEASPSLTIVNPTGYGADRNTGYLSATYQQRVRNTESDDAAFALGFGFGDARETVGVELSYTFASLGTRRDFGTGGFNVKVHRQFPDDWSVAAGWNGFVSIGDDLDGFEDSVYGVVSKVIRTQESISSPFSRVALSAGVGNGQFRTADALEDDEDGIGVFGSVAVRVAKPVSVIAEWTGQDLAVGASIAPFKNVPFVITPAVRDITGTGDGARFVLGAGLGFRF